MLKITQQNTERYLIETIELKRNIIEYLSIFKREINCECEIRDTFISKCLLLDFVCVMRTKTKFYHLTKESYSNENNLLFVKFIFDAIIFHNTIIFKYQLIHKMNTRCLSLVRFSIRWHYALLIRHLILI